jgi:hypothetical protein
MCCKESSHNYIKNNISEANILYLSFDFPLSSIMKEYL